MATSERKRESNRANAAKSTGPRSGEGKRRASGNARRHGLSVDIWRDPARREDIEKMARRLAPETEDEVILNCARDVAAAEFDVLRARRARTELLTKWAQPGAVKHLSPSAIRRLNRFGVDLLLCIRIDVVELGESAPEWALDFMDLPEEEPARSAEVARRAMQELVGIARYERRALAKRRNAVRELVDLRRHSQT